MRNRLLTSFVLIGLPLLALAQDSGDPGTDSTSSLPDSIITRPHMGPLGMDDLTGLTLYIIAIFLLVLALFLWRKSIVAKRSNA